MTTAGTVSLIALAGFVLGASAGLSVDQETVTDAALQTISFSPWGAVMIWVALSVRKGIYGLGEKWDKFLILLDKNASALTSFSKAQERQAQATEDAVRATEDATRIQEEAVSLQRDARPKTDPRALENFQGQGQRDRRPKSQHPR